MVLREYPADAARATAPAPPCPRCSAYARELAEALEDRAELRARCADLLEALREWDEAAALTLRRDSLFDEANPNFANLDAQPREWTDRIERERMERYEARRRVGKRAELAPGEEVAP